MKLKANIFIYLYISILYSKFVAYNLKWRFGARSMGSRFSTAGGAGMERRLDLFIYVYFCSEQQGYGCSGAAGGVFKHNYVYYVLYIVLRIKYRLNISIDLSAFSTTTYSSKYLIWVTRQERRLTNNEVLFDVSVFV